LTRQGDRPRLDSPPIVSTGLLILTAGSETWVDTAPVPGPQRV